MYKEIEASDLKRRNSIKSSSIFLIFITWPSWPSLNVIFLVVSVFFHFFRMRRDEANNGSNTVVAGVSRRDDGWWTNWLFWSFVLVHRSEPVVCFSLALVVCVCRSHSFALCLCISFTSASATYFERRSLFAPFVSFAPFVLIVCIDRGPTCVDLDRRSLLAGKLLHVGRYWCGNDYNIATSCDFIHDFAHLH